MKITLMNHKRRNIKFEKKEKKKKQTGKENREQEKWFCNLRHKEKAINLCFKKEDRRAFWPLKKVIRPKKKKCVTCR